MCDPSKGASRTAELSNLEVLDRTLWRAARTDKDIVVLTADSRISGKIDQFAKSYPDRIVEVGIAEQNLVGVAAGLASCGKKPFVISQACFLTARSLEQIKVDVGYCQNPVRLVGISAGISYGPLGATHHSISDFASLRAIPGIRIVAPADNSETEAAVLAAISDTEPVYIRLGKRRVSHIHNTTSSVDIRSISVVKKGSEILLLGTGETVHFCIEAAEELLSRNATATVASVPMVRPLDTPGVLKLCKAHSVVIVCEEHSINGGLGDSIAKVLMEHRVICRFASLGIPDEQIRNGSQLEVLAHYRISRQGITETALSLLQNTQGNSIPMVQVRFSPRPR